MRTQAVGRCQLRAAQAGEQVLNVARSQWAAARVDTCAAVLLPHRSPLAYNLCTLRPAGGHSEVALSTPVTVDSRTLLRPVADAHTSEHLRRFFGLPRVRGSIE